MRTHLHIVLFLVIVLTFTSYGVCQDDAPRLVNIINFIRQTEPRDHTQFSDEYLYETVVEQVNLLKQYKLPGTF
ncbi:MAG: hypothetical protein LBU65_10370, partial [Planctomycetaceae bacterium]|nr:hypothetical protein [Planctomycetaceae bacterium]